MEDTFSVDRLDKLDVGLALDLKMAFRRNGWSEAEIKQLTAGDMLAHVREVLKERSEIKAIPQIVDLDANPFVPDGWTVEEHRKGGLIDLSKGSVALFHTEDQRRGGWHGVVGDKLRAALEHQPVLNANALDFYLANPRFIPEDFKEKYVGFWGTIYRNREGYPCVRYIFWYGGWRDGSRRLNDDWAVNRPAACLQPST